MDPSVPKSPSLFGLLIEPDFVLIRMALVREVGWDAAAVMQRMYWRLEVRPDGWRISHEDLAEELSLPLYAVRQATKTLRGRGWLIGERSAPWDATPTWRMPDLDSRGEGNLHLVPEVGS